MPPLVTEELKAMVRHAMETGLKSASENDYREIALDLARLAKGSAPKENHRRYGLFLCEEGGERFVLLYLVGARDCYSYYLDGNGQRKLITSKNCHGLRAYLNSLGVRVIGEHTNVFGARELAQKLEERALERKTAIGHGGTNAWLVHCAKRYAARVLENAKTRGLSVGTDETHVLSGLELLFKNMVMARELEGFGEKSAHRAAKLVEFYSHGERKAAMPEKLKKALFEDTLEMAGAGLLEYFQDEKR